jgi:predicted nucleic acid-binding protein
VTVCIDTNVLLGFFNSEPDKVESCTAFFQLLFTKRIKSVVATITLLELAAILTATDQSTETERIIKSIESLPLFSIAEFRNGWIVCKKNRLWLVHLQIINIGIRRKMKTRNLPLIQGI